MTSLTELWPPYQLQLETPRLTLRVIRDEDLPAAFDAALSGIHAPDAMPFSSPWTQVPPEELGPNMAKWHWQCRAGMRPESWTLLLGIWFEGRLIGCQDIGAKDFDTLRTVSTGSWLSQSAQGQGLGKEMRAAVVSYAFDYLKAEAAESEAAAWNASSLGVSKALGYGLNGTFRDSWEKGKFSQVQRVILTPKNFVRPDWTLKVQGHKAFATFINPAETR
ncbi:GNAT family N-acetyltransferase [Pseudarthrobacter sp. J1763]|uniref:GNAT family N-acetyltransferase n=1 Tax=Pseudarthrobacter sp. J1763 TaxID=3420445 RepID=UPI003D2E938E